MSSTPMCMAKGTGDVRGRSREVLRLTALASACFMSYATFAAPPPDHGLEPLPTLPDTFTNGDGTVLSLEGGWPFALGSGDTAEDLTGWRIEPQAQVIWQRVDVDDLVDDIARVRYSDGVSTVGRLGIRLNRIGSGQGRNGGPRPSDAWLRLNAWHEFNGSPRTEFSSATGYVPFTAEQGGHALELVTMMGKAGQERRGQAPRRSTWSSARMAQGVIDAQPSQDTDGPLQINAHSA